MAEKSPRGVYNMSFAIYDAVFAAKTTLFLHPPIVLETHIL
jgi:hypothetical protein